MILKTDVLKNIVALSLGNDHERYRRIPGEREIEVSKQTTCPGVTFEAVETQGVDGFKFFHEFKAVRVRELQIEQNEVDMGALFDNSGCLAAVGCFENNCFAL
jgi:hypothetical protein